MLDQAKRIARLTTPLGENVLSIARLDASEGLSELFTFEIEAVSELEDIDFDRLIGQPCSVTYDAMGAPDRVFHGVLTEGQWTGVRNELYVYQLTLRPWLWLLGKTQDCRIFHDKTAVDIIKETFKAHGFADFRLALTADYPALHYTVQYRETDLAFVSRLMEQHGIYYFFEHGAEAHTLVLADARSSHAPVPGLAKIPFNAHHETPQRVRLQHIRRWNSSRGLQTGKVELNDYNHLKPNRGMRRDKRGYDSYSRSDMEVFDHPGTYRSPKDGAFYAKVRLEAEQARDRRREAQGDAISLFPGALVTLDKHPRGSENQEYLIVRTRHEFESQEYRSGGSPVETDDHGTYEFLPADRQFRAPLTTQKPLIHSLQTALVTGAEGEEIDCDDHGRILVKFYWDRHKDRSCRLRVSQVWGGKAWGGVVIPRVGMEVMVAFIDGDPDRPIVVGTVQDPENNTVPYKLPQHKTRMVLKSKTHKGDGFNELRFEDEKLREEVFVHAQRDLNTVIEHDETRMVKEDRITRIEGNDDLQVSGHKFSEVVHSSTTRIGGDFHHLVGGHFDFAKVSQYFPNADRTPIFLKNTHLYHFRIPSTNEGNYTLTVKGSKSEFIGSHYRVDANETIVQSSMKDTSHLAIGSYRINSSESTYVAAKNKIVISAGQDIIITNGKGHIKIGADGIVEIKGVKIKLN